MPGHREWDPECKIFIGGLRDDSNRYDIEDVFRKYGPVRDVWVARKPPGFAFVEMEDPRDARDASRSLDGTRICGARCRVEMSDPGKRRGRGGDSDGGGGRGGGRGRSRSRSGGRGGGRGRRSPSYSRRRSPSYERGRGGARSRSPRDKKRSTSYERKRSRSPRDDGGRVPKREESRDREDSRAKDEGGASRSRSRS